jgi:hypothetical protein
MPPTKHLSSGALVISLVKCLAHSLFHPDSGGNISELLGLKWQQQTEDQTYLLLGAVTFVSLTSRSNLQLILYI